jgi:hypothetical protein
LGDLASRRMGNERQLALEQETLEVLNNAFLIRVRRGISDLLGTGESANGDSPKEPPRPTRLGREESNTTPHASTSPVDSVEMKGGNPFSRGRN